MFSIYICNFAVVSIVCNVVMKKVLLCFILCVLFFSSCQKRDIDSGLSEFYSLSKVHWGGLAVDLNGNGDSYNDLFFEYHNMLGYNPDRYYASVKRQYLEGDRLSQGYMTISLPIPKYVKESDGTYSVTAVRPLDVTFSIRDWAADQWESELVPNLKAGDDPFMSSIKFVSMYMNREDEEINVGVACNMFALDGSDDNPGTIKFVFKR